MKLYSNQLTADDFYAACPDGVYVDMLEPINRPRVRARGWDASLASMTSNRHRNSGTSGAATWDESRPATWEQHGQFFAALYEVDPDARLACYQSRDDFHDTTRGRFLPATSND